MYGWSQVVYLLAGKSERAHEKTGAVMTPRSSSCRPPLRPKLPAVVGVVVVAVVAVSHADDVDVNQVVVFPVAQLDQPKLPEYLQRGRTSGTRDLIP